VTRAGNATVKYQFAFVVGRKGMQVGSNEYETRGDIEFKRLFISLHEISKYLDGAVHSPSVVALEQPQSHYHESTWVK